MKKISVSLIALSVVLCLSPIVMAAPVQSASVTQEPSEQLTKRPLPLLYLANKAMEAHSVLGIVEQLKKRAEEVAEKEQEYAKAQERMKQLDACNVKQLSSHFKDPTAVWQKMKDTYDAREKELAIYVNSAQPTVVDGAQKAEGVTYSDQEVSELFLHWSLGKDILMDVYANQDKWGERKSAKAPSFPLWKDQKYLFDKKWDEYYTKLNLFFGVPPQGRPVIDDKKYDYKYADETKKAHDAYLKMLTAKSPKQRLVLPENLKNIPVAPRPLPPVKEITLYVGDIEDTHQIFPEWPEPWRRQIENNFADFNPNGEMAEDFIPKTFRLKNQIAGYDPTKQDNRLNVYQIEKKRLDGTKKILEAAQVALKSAKQQLQTHLGYIDVPLSSEADVLNKKEYDALVNGVKNKKYDLISQIEKRLTDTAESDEARDILSALKKDVDGKVFISSGNFHNVDQALLEAAAAEALIREQEAYYKEQKKASEQTFTQNCLLEDK